MYHKWIGRADSWLMQEVWDKRAPKKFLKSNDLVPGYTYFVMAPEHIWTDIEESMLPVHKKCEFIKMAAGLLHFKTPDGGIIYINEPALSNLVRILYTS